jgi:hypothetical protein
MRVEHHDTATLEGLALDLADKIIQALDTATHQRAHQDRGVVIKRCAEHGGHREDDVAIDHPRVEHLADLADPVVHIDFGTSQTQRRFATHRDPMGALATVEAAVFDIPHLVRVATREHLGHQTMVVGRLIARMGVCELVPVLGKDLLEDVPVPRGCCKHEGAPS